MVKNPPASAGDVWDTGSIPESGRSPRGGHGNALQYSCLENPMDRGAWWAAVHSVTQSRAWLKRLSMHAHMHDNNKVYNHPKVGYSRYAPIKILYPMGFVTCIAFLYCELQPTGVETTKNFQTFLKCNRFKNHKKYLTYPQRSLGPHNWSDIKYVLCELEIK